MKPHLTKEEQEWPFAVFVSYSLLAYEWGSLDKGIANLAKNYNGMNTGAGTGFGMRDVDCQFKTLPDANKFCRAVKRTFKGCETRILKREPV
jgi:hypothetical protein